MRRAILYFLIAGVFLSIIAAQALSTDVFAGHGFVLLANQAAQAGTASPGVAVAALEKGKPIERTLSGKEVHYYWLALKEHQFARVMVEQRGVDVTVDLLDSAGTPLATYDSDARPQGKEVADIATNAAATYRLRLQARYPKIAAGNYQIELVEVRAATDKDRDEFEAHKLATQGQNLRNAGKPAEALKFAQQALERGEKALGPDDLYLGELLMRVGQLQRIRGDNDAGETTLKRSIAIFEKASQMQDPRAALALQYLGQTFWGRNDMIKAEQYEQQGQDILRKTLGDEHPLVAGSLMQMSTYRVRRGDFAAAQSQLQTAMAIADKTVEPDDQLSIGLANNLGNLYLEQDDLDRAEPLMERALQGAEKKYGPDSAMLLPILQNLGSISRNRKKYPRALELLNRAETIATRELGPQKPETASLLINIGNVYWDQKVYPKAVEYFQHALSIEQTAAGPYHDYTRAALANLALLYTEMGDMPHAIEYQTRVAQVIDKQIEFNLAIGSERQRLAYRNFMAIRTDLTLSFHLQNDPKDPAAAELAALTILRRKGRVLDSLSENFAALRERMKPEDQKLMDQLAGTDAQLAKVALRGAGKTGSPSEYLQQLHQLETQKEELESDISRRTQAYFEPTDAINLNAIKSAIPANAALVELAVYRPNLPQTEKQGEAHYCAYIIRHEGDIRWADLGNAQEIDKATAALREALQDPARNDVRKLARVADAKIFAPIRPLVGDAKHLLIAPDGELDLIPFEALLDDHGHYLVERFSVSYLSTGRDLLRMQAPRPPSKSVPLLVANPVFGAPATTMLAKAEKPASGLAARRAITRGASLTDVYFAPLAGTEREARSIQALFPTAELLTGTRATKAAVEQADAPQILHIATHGFFLEDDAGKSQAKSAERGASAKAAGAAELDNPLLRSGLALAGANSGRAGTGGGILTALEASNLNLWGTKLVTLSACDTGLGDVKNGEGVYGLRRAFVLAGSETLVMSLWPVSDEVTREMMTSYYTGLKKGLGRGDALRQTELAMLKRKGREHPFYWASFIQSGEWANLDGRR